MKFCMPSTIIFSVILMACGSGGSSKDANNNSESSSVAQGHSETVNTCRDIKPVCTVTVTPETSVSIRYPQTTPFSVVAKCNTFVGKTSWINLNWSRTSGQEVGVELGLDFLVKALPSSSGAMSGYAVASENNPAYSYYGFDLSSVTDTRIDHPFRFNYANCAGGGQIDFCFFTNGFPGAEFFMGTPLCKLAKIEDTAPFSMGTLFSSTGSFLIGSRVVAPDLLFPSTFSVGKIPGTWSANNGGNNDNSASSSSTATVIAGNDAECKKGDAVFQAQVCTSIESQVGVCAISKQTSKCFSAVLKESNGCLASDIDLLKQLIRDADQSALDVCTNTNTSTKNSTPATFVSSASNSSACRDLQTIPPEDFATNQQACECGGGVFSKTSTNWSCKYSKTIRGCGRLDNGKWQCGVGDV